MLRLKVLGGLSVTRDGRPLSGALAQPRRLAVLALLARSGQSGVPRERIVATLWPDVEDERARHTFNQTLYAIRREAADDEVIAGMRELRLNTDLVSIDVVDFQSAVANRDLQRAVELYDGPFLDGFHLPGTDEFARWVERERGTLERTYTTALEQLARDATARDDHLAAVQWWRTRASRDPLDARVAIALMQALDAAGDRSGAIQHARVYELLVDEELSLPPDREVVRFAAALRRDQRAAADAAVPVALDEPSPPVAVGIAVPADTKVLLAQLEGVGRDFPLSIEKLCPVLSYYVVRDWQDGCQRCMEILRYGGMGHTMSIHSQNEQVILEFGLKKPAYRVIVNSPTTHGSIGLTTGLDPAMTLGCGGYGGNITSDNISPRHLLNVKRLAYEITPAANRFERGATPAVGQEIPPPKGLAADELTRQIDAFLGSKGFRSAGPASSAAAPATAMPGSSASTPPLSFVCEDDVRDALKAGRKLVLSERAIVTPAARDLGEQHQVFETPPWRS